MHVVQMNTPLALAIVLMALSGCNESATPGDDDKVRIRFEVAASVQERALNEISGIEVVNDTDFVVFNDDGDPDLWLLNPRGEVIQKLSIQGAKNRDWEDITRFQKGGRTVVAVGDIGDNLGIRASIRVYFVEWPPLQNTTEIDLLHQLKLTYPDGPRDCESMAYDPVSKRLLFVTKRDKPPRMYAVDIDDALSQSELQLRSLGEVAVLRPPTREDMRLLGEHGQWISQPTGMDISDDGSTAALITYRSLYLFERQPGQPWEDVFRTRPREFLGPKSNSEEAIAFDPTGRAVFISSEDRPAPIYRAILPERAEQQ